MKALQILVLCTLTGLCAPVAASPSLFVALPDLSALTMEAGSWMGNELRALNRAITTLPPFLRGHRPVSIALSHGANHMIVAASRLPAGTQSSGRN